MSAVPSQQSAVFDWPVRVYYEDTDAIGVVYYANYLRFFERARTEWLRHLGLDQATIATRDAVVFVVRGADVRYVQPARLDDQLIIRTEIAEMGRASLTFAQRCECAGNLLATARVDVGCVRTDTLRPARLPADILNRLNAWAASPSSFLAKAHS